MTKPKPGDQNYTRWALFSNAIHNALLECNDDEKNWPKLSYRERVAEEAWERFHENVEANKKRESYVGKPETLPVDPTVPPEHLRYEPEASRPIVNGPQRHAFYTTDFNGATCSKCALPFSDGNHYPIGEHDRCGCEGCPSCAGHVLGCTCDVDWDKVYGHE